MNSLKTLDKLNAVQPLLIEKERELNQLLWWAKHNYIDDLSIETYSESNDEGGSDMYCRIRSITICEDRENEFIEYNFARGKYKDRSYDYGLRFQEALIQDFNDLNPNHEFDYPKDVSPEDKDNVEKLNLIFKCVIKKFNYEITLNHENALDYINYDATFKCDIDESNFLDYDYNGNLLERPNFSDKEVEIVLKDNKDHLIKLLECYD
jgi:hypothetical protein